MKRSTIAWIALALLAGVLSASCTSTPDRSPAGAQAPNPPTASATHIVDSMGRRVEFARPVTRAVVVYSQLLLTMKAIGVNDDVIVGLDEFTLGQYEDVFAGIKGKPTVGKNLFSLDGEKLLRLEAEALIATPTTLNRMPELAARLERVGTRIVCLDFELKNVKDVVNALGLMFGRRARAEEFGRFWFSKLDLVAGIVNRLPEKERVKVYWENTNTPYDTINKRSPGHEIVELAGGCNIARDLVGNKADPEWIITQNPDVIIKYPMGSIYQGGFGRTDPGPFRAMRTEIIDRPGFNQIKAVKDGRVYIVSQLIKTGVFENVAVCYIAKLLHPDLFRDLDPADHLREMVENYLGLGFGRMEGVFVHPEPWRRKTETEAGATVHRSEP